MVFRRLFMVLAVMFGSAGLFAHSVCAEDNASFILGPEDVLGIVVYGEKDLSGD